MQWSTDETEEDEDRIIRNRYRQAQTGQMNSQVEQWRRQMEEQDRRNRGLPVGGIVGAPDLGRASELMRWGSQMPGGMQYLQQQGMAPNISTSRWQSGQSGDYGKVSGEMRQQGSPAFGQQFQGGGQQFQGGGQQLLQQLGRGIQREQSPFERMLQGGVQGMLQNPTMLSRGQQSQMYTQATDPIAAQTRQNVEDVREDAIRRGASGAQGDVDIRDQINRTQMEGASRQSQAGFDVSRYLSELGRQGRQSGLQLGSGLLGQQLGDVRSIREMITLLEALKQQVPVGLQMGLGSL